MQDETIEVKYKPTRKLKMRTIAIVAAVLLTLNFGILAVLYQTKKIFGDFSSSAKKAALSSSKFLPWQSSADVQTIDKDVAGQDPASVKRMSGTSRTFYLFDEQNKRTTYEYQANANAKEVLDFYKYETVNSGYILKSADKTKAVLEKDGRQFYIEIKNESPTLTSYKIIEIVL